MDPKQVSNQEPDQEPDTHALSRLIQAHATRYAAPASLRAGLRTQAALADASRPPAEPQRAGGLGRWAGRWSRHWTPRWAWPRWRSASIGFVLGLACMALVAPLLQRWAQEATMDGALVASHVHALRLGPLTEVVSSDQHTVKPWFQGRLDFAPPVQDLADKGFPLLGGRTEQLHGNRVASLAYSRGQHVIDLYIWPSSSQQAQVRSVQRGFNLLSWSDGAMQFWAVSDLNRRELAQFAQLWRDGQAAQ